MDFFLAVYNRRAEYVCVRCTVPPRLIDVIPIRVVSSATGRSVKAVFVFVHDHNVGENSILPVELWQYDGSCVHMACMYVRRVRYTLRRVWLTVFVRVQCVWRAIVIPTVRRGPGIDLCAPSSTYYARIMNIYKWLGNVCGWNGVGEKTIIT